MFHGVTSRTFAGSTKAHKIFLSKIKLLLCALFSVQREMKKNGVISDRIKFGRSL
jgi:hypothetical protein